MKKSRYSDDRIIGMLSHEQRHVLHMALQVRRHGRLNDGAAQKNPALWRAQKVKVINLVGP